MSILAIDPGNIESAYAVLGDGLELIKFKKCKNEELITNLLLFINEYEVTHIAIEAIASYGMAVGATVFETCIWVGRFHQEIERNNHKVSYIYRKDEKMNLCHSMKAKDSNIRQALIDRFGPVGVKKSPGWFYGVSKDVWSAVAVGVTYADLYINNK